MSSSPPPRLGTLRTIERVATGECEVILAQGCSALVLVEPYSQARLVRLNRRSAYVRGWKRDECYLWGQRTVVTLDRIFPMLVQRILMHATARHSCGSPKIPN